MKTEYQMDCSIIEVIGMSPQELRRAAGDRT